MSIAGYTVNILNGNTYAIEEKTPMSQGLCYLLCGQEKAMLIDNGIGCKNAVSKSLKAGQMGER